MFCVAVFIIAGFGLLIYQLYALQLRDAELYRTEAVTQQMKDITLPALRGSIYSVNGKLLAKSNTVWNIVADPSSIAKSGATEAQLRTAAQGLADLLGDGTTADALYEILTAKNANGTPYQYRMLAKGVEKPVADAIVSYADTYTVTSLMLDGGRLTYVYDMPDNPPGTDHDGHIDTQETFTIGES